MANKRQLQPERIAHVICSCRTQKQAAAELRISPRSLFDYLQMPETQAAIKTIRAEMLRNDLEKLNAAQETAVDVLRGIMESSETRDSDRIAAARVILESCRAARIAIHAADQSAAAALLALNDTGIFADMGILS